MAMQEKIGNARTAAFETLCRLNEEPQFAQQVLDGVLRETQLSDADRRLATEMTYGIVRREVTLDAILANFVKRGREGVEPELWVLLRLGAYQLIFLDGVPAHAAVNETVALAKNSGNSRWVGFANGTLRTIARSLNEEPITAPARNAVPTRNTNFRRFERDLFPDPDSQPVEYYAAAFGFNQWISQRWLERYGAAEISRIGFWYNAPVAIYLRANLLRTSRDALLAFIVKSGVAAVAGQFPESIKLEGPARIAELPGYHEGHFSVQDESAMAAARLLNPASGERVWDLCAAPGGKTSHLAELMQNTGEILATDINQERLDRVSETRDRLGLSIIKPHLISTEGTDFPDGPFDAILIDAPCSNSGVLGKRAEARHRLTQKHLWELRELQLELLHAGLERLGPKGRLVYSTCSIEPEENFGVVETVLSQRSDTQLRKDREQSPGRPTDGGYQALLARR